MGVARTSSADAHIDSQYVPVVEALGYVRFHEPFLALVFSHASTHGRRY
jgi:hypothetical protein